jgi:hypothetical protein
MQLLNIESTNELYLDSDFPLYNIIYNIDNELDVNQRRPTHFINYKNLCLEF